MRRINSILLLLVLSLLLMGNTSSSRITEHEKIADSIANVYFEASQQYITEWENAQLQKRITLTTANGNGYLYRVINNKKQYGFFTVASISPDVNHLEVIISTTQGEDPLVENPQAYYYSLPFEFYEHEQYSSMNLVSIANKIKPKSQVQLVSLLSVDTSKLPPVPSEYYYTYYIQYYSVQKILNTPEYYNEVLFNGCAPTSGAMLVAFYDLAIDDWDDLVDGTPPLHHDDNEEAVEDLITLMGDYMNWTTTGTALGDMNDGLDDYFDDFNHGDYHTIISTDDADYKQVIWAGNPSVLAIYTDGSSVPNHAVLGIGVSNTYMIGTRYIVRYNWRSRSGEYSINPNLFYSVTYMSR